MKSRRTSKYVGKNFGGWECVEIGIANIQGRKSKAPGARNHYYVFERRTSDNKADKIVRLNSSEAAKVYKGIKCVEEIVDHRIQSNQKFERNITYHFD